MDVSKLTELTSLASASNDDILYIVDDPDGTEVSYKITLANLRTSLFVSIADPILIASSDGINMDTTAGDDADIDILTLNVTGTPKLWWDESEDKFTLSKGLVVAGGLNVNGVVVGPAGVTEQDGVLITTPTIATNVGRGLNVLMDFSGASGSTTIQAAGTVSGSGDHDHCYGVQTWNFHTSTGTTVEMAGIMSTLDVSAGTVTTWYGLLLPAIAVAGGTVTNAWHIFAESARRSFLPDGIVLSDELIATPSKVPSAIYGVCRIHHDYALSGAGFTKYGVLVLSTDTAAVGTGGVIAMGGESGHAVTPYPFAHLIGAKEQAGATYNGYLAIHTTDTDSNNTEKLRVTSGGDLCLGGTTIGTNATKTLVLFTGVAPASSVTDGCAIYSADQTAGNACLHTRTENGKIVKLFQSTHIDDFAGDGSTAVNAILDLLEATGLMAPAA